MKTPYNFPFHKSFLERTNLSESNLMIAYAITSMTLIFSYVYYYLHENCVSYFTRQNILHQLLPPTEANIPPLLCPIPTIQEVIQI